MIQNTRRYRFQTNMIKTRTVLSWNCKDNQIKKYQIAEIILFFFQDQFIRRTEN